MKHWVPKEPISQVWRKGYTLIVCIGLSYLDARPVLERRSTRDYSGGLDPDPARCLVLSGVQGTSPVLRLNISIV